jgi:hypothetical protein
VRDEHHADESILLVHGAEDGLLPRGDLSLERVGRVASLGTNRAQSRATPQVEDARVVARVERVDLRRHVVIVAPARWTRRERMMPPTGGVAVMPKNIVICCDGTWNKPEQIDRGVLAPTNVVKTARAASIREKDKQYVYYDRGVGSGAWDRIRGGAFGIGLSKNVRQAYRAIVDHYEEDDRVFLFGFSRGAYTVRSLGGLLHKCGLLRRDPDADLDKLVAAAYLVYRDRKDDGEAFKQAHSQDIKITMLGVWDTVRALGVPLRLLNFIARKRHIFHDHKLRDNVLHAYHALAIDEKRRIFKPVRWDMKDKKTRKIAEEVWFVGVHSNIGGGYMDDGLSDTALQWMLRKARKHGMLLNKRYLQLHVQHDFHGLLRDSREGLLKKLLYGKCVRHIAAGERIHWSVKRRIQSITSSYDPENVPDLGKCPVVY